MSVLMLNASYEPLRVISVRRAVGLLLQRKAEIVEVLPDSVLRAQHTRLATPLVIRLLRYVAHPRTRALACSRRSVLLRDRETCQYCGAQPGRENLTIDHVIPRAQGGRTVWENVVAACRQCNHSKGNRRPEQAGMVLRTTPRRPPSIAFVLLHSGIEQHPVWSQYAYI